MSVEADVVAACRVLEGEGLTESFGHVSARREDGTILMTPRVGPGLVDATDELLVLDADGRCVDGDPALVPGEAALHGGVYRARDDVHGVCRFHGPACLAVSTLGRELPVVVAYGMFLGGAVALHATASTVTDAAGADAVAATMGARFGVMLRGFGAVVGGATVRDALVRTVLMERNAAAFLAASGAGPPDTFADEQVAGFLSNDAARAEQIARTWTYLTTKHGGRP